MRVMAKLRTKFYKLNVNIGIVLAYVWTFAAIAGIALGAMVDNLYFLAIPVLMLIPLEVGKTRMSFLFRMWVIIGMIGLILDVATKDIGRFTIYASELIIILVGPVFFKEHAS